MDNLNYEVFKNICRICMLDCCINFTKDAVILDIYHKLTDIHFETNDELPQQICHKCFDFINEIHSFSITCKQSHSALMQCLNNHKNQGINEEPEQIKIKDEVTIEEHVIEFVKDELNNDCETNDLLNDDVNNRTISSNIQTENSESSQATNKKKKYKGVALKCDQCKKSFIQIGSLIRHKRVAHSVECPIKCDQCEKSFIRIGSLKRHERVHSGERPYKCDQCKKSFTDAANLNRHKRVHSGEHPYNCDQCEKSFKQSQHLTIHKRVHSGEHPYKCDQCGKSFTHSGNFKRHKRMHSDHKATHLNVKNC